MPLHDPDFGEKLKALQSAVGFRFPPGDFSNASLARLLNTTEQTMSRKKKGKRLVTESDWSVLTDYFDLARYSFQPGMWALGLASFDEQMLEVGRQTFRDSKPNEARKNLMELATGGCGGRLHIELAYKRTRGSGIGTEPSADVLPVFSDGDQVCIKLDVPKDGHLVIVNDSRDSLTCLMPSHFAPRMIVKAGKVRVPTSYDFPCFPVGGRPGRYRIYGVWFAQRPPIALAATEGDHNPPRDLDPHEFVELVELAQKVSVRAEAVMVAFGDYEKR